MALVRNGIRRKIYTHTHHNTSLRGYQNETEGTRTCWSTLLPSSPHNYTYYTLLATISGMYPKKYTQHLFWTLGSDGVSLLSAGHFFHCLFFGLLNAARHAFLAPIQENCGVVVIHYISYKTFPRC